MKHTQTGFASNAWNKSLLHCGFCIAARLVLQAAVLFMTAISLTCCCKPVISGFRCHFIAIISFLTLRCCAQSTPPLTAAALELLQRFPPKDCKTPVEASHRLFSPRGGRSLRSPGQKSGRASDRSDLVCPLLPARQGCFRSIDSLTCYGCDIPAPSD